MVGVKQMRSDSSSLGTWPVYTEYLFLSEAEVLLEMMFMK